LINKCVEQDEKDSGAHIDATTGTTDVGADRAYYGFCSSSVYSGEGGEWMQIGKCPKCDAVLSNKDIDVVNFKGVVGEHNAYRCKNCNYIIGFSSMFKS
jgi:hypothetical protein